jgi:hypothetical protein
MLTVNGKVETVLSRGKRRRNGEHLGNATHQAAEPHGKLGGRNKLLLISSIAVLILVAGF